GQPPGPARPAHPRPRRSQARTQDAAGRNGGPRPPHQRIPAPGSHEPRTARANQVPRVVRGVCPSPFAFVLHAAPLAEPLPQVDARFHLVVPSLAADTIVTTPHSLQAGRSSASATSGWTCPSKSSL